MQEGPVFGERLDSWKEIASYINRSVRTVIRWEVQKGLPVRRIPGGERHSVFAYKHEIDLWMRNGCISQVDPVESEVPEVPASTSPVEAPGSADPLVQGPSIAISERETRTRAKVPWRRPRLAEWGIAAALIALLCAGYWFATPRKIVAANETQITSDGLLKMRLVTDGSHLYFGEWRGGRIVLSTVGVSGGAVREIPTPFVRSEPIDISADGRELLLLSSEGQEDEQALWVMPSQGGVPRRIGNVFCHYAAWSPGDKSIAFARGAAIYVTGDEGKTETLLQTFTAVPEELHWSRDGRHILFRLWDMQTYNSAVWELVLAETTPPSISSLIPLTREPMRYDAVSPVIDDRDEAFVGTDGQQTRIMALERYPFSLTPRFFLREVADELNDADDLAVDPASHTLFFKKGLGGQSELEWFDPKSRQSRPFLPGVSGHDVDFSRDGRSIVFVHEPDYTLWTAAPDGTGARQIETGNIGQIELPRWSPDGQQIAFMGKHPDQPFRVFITNASGGTPREASAGGDNQGAPTWSPDGRKLVCGRVMCQMRGGCSIEEIDIKRRSVTMVPGSEGLSTARWSPDGRYIAALRPERHEILLFNTRSRTWSTLMGGVNGNDLQWSLDSRTLFASNPVGERPNVIGISIPDGRAAPVLDLSDFSKLNGRVDTWFGVAPDNSIVFVRIVSRDEIFALHYLQR